MQVEAPFLCSYVLLLLLLHSHKGGKVLHAGRTLLSGERDVV